MFRTAVAWLLSFWLGISAAVAQAPPETFQVILTDNFKLIQRSSVKTVGPLLEELQASGYEGTSEFLSKWQNKEVWYRRADNRLFYGETEDKKTYQLIDIVTGQTVEQAQKKEIRQIKPNSGVRALLDAALVRFRLTSPNVSVRRASLESVSRRPKAEHLDALREAIEIEQDPALKVRFQSVANLLSMQFGETEAERVAAIRSVGDSLDLEVRAKLNPLLSTRTSFADGGLDTIPENVNLARVIEPGKTVMLEDGSSRDFGTMDWFNGTPVELTLGQAYELLVDREAAPALVSDTQRDAALIANMVEGKVAGFERVSLNTQEARNEAYAALARTGAVPQAPTLEDMQAEVDAHVFYAAFNEPSTAVTDAARQTLNAINTSVRWNTFIDLLLDAVSLASIYFLAAIGLAITFGVMRVINMAHGEFIMMGAYTGYVVQQFITNYTVSILVAIPLAFMVTFAAGVLLERLVIRYLYDRPLETLLATFGVSIALQQLAKNIFGTQARPLTAPEWLDGALVINDVVSISWIRIAIFVMGIVFFASLWFTLNRTRLGLETRAVVQNPQMAAAMGINPDRINMLTFGLGSGIAGIAGVAIGLYAKVTSELGSDYIVQSFMTVVIGGVGNIWGTLAGAGLIGILQKLIENFNPSNTLAAQTYMIIFIIIFIQFRPRGLIALKGRAAEA